jgi:type VI protein secretion system component VasF
MNEKQTRADETRSRIRLDDSAREYVERGLLEKLSQDPARVKELDLALEQGRRHHRAALWQRFRVQFFILLIAVAATAGVYFMSR